MGLLLVLLLCGVGYGGLVTGTIPFPRMGQLIAVGPIWIGDYCIRLRQLSGAIDCVPDRAMVIAVRQSSAPSFHTFNFMCSRVPDRDGSAVPEQGDGLIEG